MKIISTILILVLSISVFGQKDKRLLKTFYPFKRDSMWGYVDKRKKVLIPFNFEAAHRFSEGLALVKKNEKYGFIDHYGNFVIDCIYNHANSFYNSYAWVRTDSLEGLLKKNGTLFKGQFFIHIATFRDGFAKIVFKNNGLDAELDESYVYAFFNHNGQHLAEKYFSGASSFRNGQAKVSISGEYFFLDTLGMLTYRKKDEFDEARLYKPVKRVKVDKMPQFLGGELGLRRFISTQVQYPKLAHELDIHGVTRPKKSLQIFVNSVVSLHHQK